MSIECVSSVLSEVCVPLAGRIIIRLHTGQGSTPNTDELMIEFELCIGLVFKPLRHNLKNVVTSNSGNSNLYSIWRAVLSVIEDFLGSDNGNNEDEATLPDSLRRTMQDLATEHLQSAIKLLMSAGAIVSEPKAPNDLSSLTWDSVARMGIEKDTVDAWKARTAANSGTEKWDAS